MEKCRAFQEEVSWLDNILLVFSNNRLDLRGGIKKLMYISNGFKINRF